MSENIQEVWIYPVGRSEAEAIRRQAKLREEGWEIKKMDRGHPATYAVLAFRKGAKQ